MAKVTVSGSDFVAPVVAAFEAVLSQRLAERDSKLAVGTMKNALAFDGTAHDGQAANVVGTGLGKSGSPDLP